ncbi:uncharacterized protein LOC122024735 [Zingiber officinale]|uniref:GIR1-like zinc ribbon domain-containing protein n=1 Tax=Zingiber officinale TaxID=94328 RepID=A0A8J5EWM5_ZINOF|nr:uncharacterized protein LOC122024735 [Zingiber officinale]KAG6475630.1 hypothetical protein ZIOFF_064858 [Zingiber officinale]
MEMSSIKEAKRDLITLDLLGGASPVVRIKDAGVVGLKSAPALGCYLPLLRPLDLNQLPDDVVRLKPAAEQLAGASQSVCTIEQVKRALEQAGRESQRKRRPHLAVERSAVSPSGRSASASSSSSSSSITTASAKRPAAVREEDGGGSSLVVAGCSGCLSYVLIAKENPRCPRCQSQVVLAAAMLPPAKRPRVALDFEMGL